MAATAEDGGLEPDRREALQAGVIPASDTSIAPQVPSGAADGGAIGVRRVRCFVGPNPYSDDPCVAATLDFGRIDLTHGEDRCRRIASRCAAWFDPPELDWQSADRELVVATFLAKWSLAALTSEVGFLHTAHALRENGEAVVCLGFHREQVTLAAIHMAVELYAQVDTLEPVQVESTLKAFWALTRRHHPDYQIAFLMRAARADGIPWTELQRAQRLWQFGWGCNARTFFESEPIEDSAIGWKLAQDKIVSKSVFASLGVPTPPFRVPGGEADLARTAEAIGWPCVVKPAGAGRGRGVTTDVSDLAQMTVAFRAARSLGKGPVMIERQVEGDVFRIDVMRGSVTVIRRFAVEVTGDGQRSVLELVEAANRTTAERQVAEPHRGPIPIDDRLRAQLKRQDLSLDAVPAAGQVVLLNRTALLAAGGSYRDVTPEAHPNIATMARLLAAGFGLEICGIDFVSRDISRSCSEEGAVLEINTTPGLLAAFDAGMSAEDVGRQVLGQAVGRIPVSLVLMAEADCGRLGAELRFADGQGWAIGERCGVGSFLLRDPCLTGDGTGSRLADRVARVLRNPLASSLTVVCTPEALAEAGLPIDRYERIMADRRALDPAWAAVLARLANEWVDVWAPEEALRLHTPAS